MQQCQSHFTILIKTKKPRAKIVIFLFQNNNTLYFYHILTIFEIINIKAGFYKKILCSGNKI